MIPKTPCPKDAMTNDEEETFNNLLQHQKNWELFPPFHNIHMDKNP
jgi:hypothetical protein